MDAAEARDIAHMRDQNALRKQIWRIEYSLAGMTGGATLINYIRADSHHNALRILTELLNSTIKEASVKLAKDQTLQAINDEGEDDE